MAVARYLADTSALARLPRPEVAARLGTLIEHGLVATCPALDLEVLYSSRNAREYEQVLAERHGLEGLDTDQVDWDRALSVQRRLAADSRHRAAGIPDLVLAAVAERHRVTLLHYDRDFDVIAEVTGQDATWVVPAGSVP